MKIDQFQDGDCMLNVPEDKPELNHFKDKWMTPKQMIQVRFTKSPIKFS